MTFRSVPSIALFAAVAVLTGCESEDAELGACSIELVEGGWHNTADQPLPAPRQDEPVGARYGVFAVTFSQRTGDELRERAAAMMSILAARRIRPSDVVEDAPSFWSSRRRFTAPGFVATWEPETDYMDAESHAAPLGSEPGRAPIGNAEAFRRFHCALAQLERASLVAPGTVPANGAALTRLISAFLGDAGLEQVRVEGYWFRTNRLVDGVVEPHSPVIVRLDASGALLDIELATPTIHSDGPPRRETPVAPGFPIARAVSFGEIEARFRAEAEAERPGMNPILGATGFEFRKRPMEFGEALVPMQWFQFVFEGLALPQWKIWSCRIDDPAAPRWDER